MGGRHRPTGCPFIWSAATARRECSAALCPPAPPRPRMCAARQHRRCQAGCLFGHRRGDTGIVAVDQLVAALQRVRLHQPGRPAGRPPPVLRRMPVDLQEQQGAKHRPGQRCPATTPHTIRRSRCARCSTNATRSSVRWPRSNPSCAARACATWLSASRPAFLAHLLRHALRRGLQLRRTFDRGQPDTRRAGRRDRDFSPSRRAVAPGSGCSCICHAPVCREKSLP
jgi:hypothetical protein